MLFNFRVKDQDRGGWSSEHLAQFGSSAGMTNDSEPHYYRWRNSVLSDFGQNGSINVNKGVD